MEQVDHGQLTSYRPKRIDRFEIQFSGEQGEQGLFTLKNVECRTYLRLTESGRMLWDMLDGTRDVAALLNECQRLGQPLSPARLLAFLDLLERKAMIQPASKNTDDRASVASLPRLLEKALYREWPIKVGALIEWLYRRLVWVFYTRPAIIVLSALSIAGPLCFVAAMLWNAHATTIGPVGVLNAVILMVTNIVIVVLHESAHAFTCRHFEREVPRVGLMLYYGSLCTFVDTSDIWMCSKEKRILTSAAGPISSWVLGSLASVFALSLPFPMANRILFQVAAWCFLASLFPLNPLMEFDGYYMLVDWLETPQLRRKALHFVTRQLFSRLRSHTPLTRRECAYLIYGLLALLFSTVSVLAPFYLVLNYSIRRWIAGSGILWTAVPVFAAMALSLTSVLIARITNRTRKYNLSRTPEQEE